MTVEKAQWTVKGLLLALGALEAVVHPTIKNGIINFAHKLNAKQTSSTTSGSKGASGGGTSGAG